MIAVAERAFSESQVNTRTALRAVVRRFSHRMYLFWTSLVVAVSASVSVVQDIPSVSRCPARTGTRLMIRFGN
jgi:hypothetical protein